jgi:hypothetical protein
MMHPVWTWFLEARKQTQSREFNSITDVKESKTFQHVSEIIQRS